MQTQQTKSIFQLNLHNTWIVLSQESQTGKMVYADLQDEAMTSSLFLHCFQWKNSSDWEVTAGPKSMAVKETSACSWGVNILAQHSVMVKCEPAEVWVAVRSVTAEYALMGKFSKILKTSVTTVGLISESQT